MKFELKPLSPDGVASALEKAKHYRLLNEPMQAESICLDILETEAGHPEAIITLVLALTDQFDSKLGRRHKQCRELLARLDDDFKRSYYAGIAAERRAIAHMRTTTPGAAHLAYEWFREAMGHYEAADQESNPDDDLAVLRWNACARVLNDNPYLKPEPERPRVTQFGE